MEIQDFLEHFADQFVDTDFSEFQPETKFRELEEWSSIIALSLITMIDEEYDVALKGEDIRRSETIQDIFDLVKHLKK